MIVFFFVVVFLKKFGVVNDVSYRQKFATYSFWCNVTPGIDSHARGEFKQVI